MKSSSGTSGALTARAKAARSVSIGEVFREEFLLLQGGEDLPSGLAKSVSMSGKGSRCETIIVASGEEKGVVGGIRY